MTKYMKTLLPWLCVVGLVFGLGWVYFGSQKKDAELAVLREESQQLQQLRDEMEATNSARATADSQELVRLRKENDELLRLRNEVNRLRQEKQQLGAQLQTAQTEAQGAPGHAQSLRENPGQPAVSSPLTPAAPGTAGARTVATPQATEQQQAAICMKNLRLIEAAKQQWAAEKQKPKGALLVPADLEPYLKTNALPTCPAGGVYTINPVGYSPLCSIPGHTLGQ